MMYFHPKTRPAWFLVFALIVLVLLASSCRRQPQGLPFDESIVVALVPFSQAVTTADLMAGYISPGSQAVSEEALAGLDQSLEARITQPVMASMEMAPCLEQAASALEDQAYSRLDYLVEAGKCAGADYVLSPQVLYWKEREGSAVGVTEPAGVAIDFHVVDVAEHSLDARVHFEEDQVSLAENLLTIDKFVSRYGAWLTARELAEEAIDKAVLELGL